MSLGVGVRSDDLFRAEVLGLLLEELGYVVSDPAELVTRANLAYLYLAEGEFDVWVGARLPADQVWLDGERFDGTSVGASMSVLGGESPAVGVFGWLISKTFADEHGVFTLDDLDRDPAALAAFDAVDAVPGNGKAEILSWPELGIAAQVVASQIAFSGWDNIAQLNVGYVERFEMAVDAVARGVPMIAAAGDPSQLAAKLRPGVEVYWLGVEQILDGSNPLGQSGGELYSQVTRGVNGDGGHAPFGIEVCPAARDHSLGLCPLGWDAGELRVAANAEFATANPAAVALLDAVVVPTVDISQALVREAEGDLPSVLAAEWIAANRASVDEWLAAARAAASRA
ncbi:glycine betaine ABC transporter substrate-binding protein [Candidatus Poriferisodalis sp.]|uniref:glycine betaine ABC transporter substrate-binding protein n=1 Tax=Candidatus Poriferisodalis sp. TaxID=3101277 RepID=UPI003AF59C74